MAPSFKDAALSSGNLLRFSVSQFPAALACLRDPFKDTNAPLALRAAARPRLQRRGKHAVAV